MGAGEDLPASVFLEMFSGSTLDRMVTDSRAAEHPASAMALFGRESQREAQRARRVGEWVRARTPYALPAMLFGIVSVVDAFLLLGLIFGPAAIVLGVLGRRDLGVRTHLLGRGLCNAAIILGMFGLALSLSILIYYHRPTP